MRDIVYLFEHRRKHTVHYLSDPSSLARSAVTVGCTETVHRDRWCQGRSNPRCHEVGSSTRNELATGTDSQYFCH